MKYFERISENQQKKSIEIKISHQSATQCTLINKKGTFRILGVLKMGIKLFHINNEIQYPNSNIIKVFDFCYHSIHLHPSNSR